MGHDSMKPVSEHDAETDYGDDHYVAANMKIASHPGAGIGPPNGSRSCPMGFQVSW